MWCRVSSSQNRPNQTTTLLLWTLTTTLLNIIVEKTTSGSLLPPSGNFNTLTRSQWCRKKTECWTSLCSASTRSASAQTRIKFLMAEQAVPLGQTPGNRKNLLTSKSTRLSRSQVKCPGTRVWSMSKAASIRSAMIQKAVSPLVWARQISWARHSHDEVILLAMWMTWAKYLKEDKPKL